MKQHHSFLFMLIFLGASLFLSKSEIKAQNSYTDYSWSTCANWATKTYANGKYVLRNNIWGASTPQCIGANSEADWGVWAQHSGGYNVKAYPQNIRGWAIGNGYMTPRSQNGMGVELNALTKANLYWKMEAPTTGTFMSLFDIYFHRTADPGGEMANFNILLFTHNRDAYAHSWGICGEAGSYAHTQFTIDGQEYRIKVGECYGGNCASATEKYFVVWMGPFSNSVTGKLETPIIDLKKIIDHIRNLGHMTGSGIYLTGIHSGWEVIEGGTYKTKGYWTAIQNEPNGGGGSTPTTYALTVNSGTGTGNYTAGSNVSISANAAPSGKVFDKWTGSTAIANLYQASTSITMPASNTTIYATYKDEPTGGTDLASIVSSTAGAQQVGNNKENAYDGNTSSRWANDGTIANGWIEFNLDQNYSLSEIEILFYNNTSRTYPIDIQLNGASVWSGNTALVSGYWTKAISGTGNKLRISLTGNNSDNSAWFSINEIRIKGTPVTVAQYSLTVNSGTGSGNYASGTVVNIAANAAPSGKVFDQWTGSSAIANVNAATTTITMPSAATTITAAYKDAPVTTYALTVNSGTGTGNYAAGTVVNITANAAPSGKVFDQWTGSSAIANVNAATTTITMPSAVTSISATYKDVPTSGEEVKLSGTMFGTGTWYTNSDYTKSFDGNTSTFYDGDGANGRYVGIELAMATKVTKVRFQPRASWASRMTGGKFQGSNTSQTSGYVDLYTISSAPAYTMNEIVITNTTEFKYLRYLSPDNGYGNVAEVEFWGGGTGTTPVTYTLTVNSGLGSGSYSAGTVVNISANAAPSGKVFDKWTGSSAITDVNAATTTITMPSVSTIISATYKDAPVTAYALTVNNGSGSGNYVAGTLVNISSSAAPVGYEFDQWTGSAAIANIFATTTTINMPAAATSISATFKPIQALSNLVQNPGFEFNGESWNLASNFSVVSTDFNSGSKSLRLSGTGSWNNTWQGNIALAANTWYTFSIYAKGTGNVFMKVFNSSWTGIAEKFATPSANWSKYTLEFNSGNNSSAIVSLMDGASGTAYIDDVEVLVDLSKSATVEIINDKISLEDVRVFPNPVRNGILSVQTAEDQLIETTIFDLTGRRIKSTQFENGQGTIQVEDLKNGAYVLHVKSNHHVSTFRIVIEN